MTPLEAPPLPHHMAVATEWYRKATTPLSSLPVLSGEARHWRIISHTLHTPSAGKTARCSGDMPSMSTLQHTLFMSLSENSAHGVHVVHTKGRDFFFSFFFCLALLLLFPSGNCFLCNWTYTWGFVNTAIAAVGARKNKQKPNMATETQQNITQQIKLPTDLKSFVGTKI